jgi:hypothetical protein
MKEVVLTVCCLAVLASGMGRPAPKRSRGSVDHLPDSLPLAGEYLVHPDPDSGDYSSFSEACADLMARGASDTVVFNVAGDTYVESVRLASFTGGVPVTFRPRSSEAVVIDPMGDSAAIDLVGCEKVRFRGLAVNGGNPYGVRFHPMGEDVCRECVLDRCSVVARIGVLLTRPSCCSLICNVIRCVGGSSSGIILDGDSSAASVQNVFINNAVMGWRHRGAYMRYHRETKLLYNTFYGLGAYGFSNYYSFDLEQHNNIFFGTMYAYYHHYGETHPDASDYNCFCNLSGARYIHHSAYGDIGLPRWQTLANRDLHSIAGHPQVASITNYKLRPSSPCREAGLAFPSVPTDVDGDLRDSDPCIGADEWRSSGSLMSGVYYVHPHPDSHDYSSFNDALADLAVRGFGGSVTFSAYTGTYRGEVNLADIRNDTFELTLNAVEGEVPRLFNPDGGGFGIYMAGNSGITIQGLDITAYYCVMLFDLGTEGCCRCRILGNSLHANYVGVYMYNYCNDNLFAGNKIYCSFLYGMYSYGHSARPNKRNRFHNNMFSGATLLCLYIFEHDSTELVYNSFFAGYGYALRDSFSYRYHMRNNIFYGAGQAWWKMEGDPFPEVSDNNCWFSDDPRGYVIYSSFFGYLTFAEWQNLSGLDSNSISRKPLFVSDTDLHLQDSSPCIDAGAPVPGITTDIDGDLRGSTPDIGADEWVVSGVVERRKQIAPSPLPEPTIVGRVLWLGQSGDRPSSGGTVPVLLDITGRKVMDLQPGANDIWHLAPGVYFVRQKGPRGQGFEGPSTRKLVIQR